MNTKSGKAIRGFYQSGRPVYELPRTLEPLNYKKEVVFGFYHTCGCAPEGFGELSMRWYQYGEAGLLIPKLEVYGESLRLMWKMRNVINATWRKSPSISPEEFCELLLKMGFKDLTRTRIIDGALSVA